VAAAASACVEGFEAVGVVDVRAGGDVVVDA